MRYDEYAAIEPVEQPPNPRFAPGERIRYVIGLKRNGQEQQVLHDYTFLRYGVRRPDSDGIMGQRVFIERSYDDLLLDLDPVHETWESRLRKKDVPTDESVASHAY